MQKPCTRCAYPSRVRPEPWVLAAGLSWTGCPSSLLPRLQNHHKQREAKGGGTGRTPKPHDTSEVPHDTSEVPHKAPWSRPGSESRGPRRAPGAGKSQIRSVPGKETQSQRATGTNMAFLVSLRTWCGHHGRPEGNHVVGFTDPWEHPLLRQQPPPHSLGSSSI